MISNTIIALLIGTGMAYLAAFLIFKKEKPIVSESFNSLTTAAMFLLVALKLSLLITHTSDLQKEPLGLLYNWGTAMNTAVGVLAGLFYLLWYLLKKGRNPVLKLKAVGLQIVVFLVFWNLSSFILDIYTKPQYVLEKTQVEQLFTLKGNKYQMVTSPIYILNFWGSWCPPCRAEMPELDAFALNHPEIELLAVNYTPSEKQGIEGVKEFIETKEYRFDVLLDLDGSLKELYEVSSFPTTLIFDKDGKVLKKITGPVSRTLLEGYVDR